MAAGRLDVLVERGATFKLPLVLSAGGVPINLTGYKARAHMREEYDAPTFFASFSTEDGSIQVDPLNGRVTLVAPSTVTAAITASKGVWDLELIGPDPTPLDDKVVRVLQGKVTVSPEATR